MVRDHICIIAISRVFINSFDGAINRESCRAESLGGRSVHLEGVERGAATCNLPELQTGGYLRERNRIRIRATNIVLRPVDASLPNDGRKCY